MAGDYSLALISQEQERFGKAASLRCRVVAPPFPGAAGTLLCPISQSCCASLKISSLPLHPVNCYHVPSLAIPKANGLPSLGWVLESAGLNPDHGDLL